MEEIPFSPLLAPLINSSQDLFPIKQEFEDSLLNNNQQQEELQPSSFFTDFSLNSSISNLFLPFDTQTSSTNTNDTLSFDTNPSNDNPFFFDTNANANSLSSPLNTDVNYYSPISSPLDDILPTTYAQLSAPGPARTEKTRAISSIDPLHKPLSQNMALTPLPLTTNSSEPIVRKTAVTLTKDEILRFTTQDLDDLVRRLQIERGGGSLSTVLTPTERSEIKRQKRLIKNRESAQLSRQRKRDRVDELEAIIKDLDTVHTKLDSEVKQLEGDHIILKAELNQLMSVIRDSPQLSSLMLHMTSLVLLYTAVQKKTAENIVSNTIVATTLASAASSSSASAPKALNVQPQYVC
eukprot:TRINITY_DN1970_c1_g1_i2.p1 TRINITY_DN1970_c1_g1~~TRINITY_DN1970_c1_g1_i2.p1  ORF type:complete len:351 (+),score=89.63 TRINITY_DN1970_c1_g1_i2:177-1229(+)